MRTRFFATCCCLLIVTGCSANQVGSAAYGGLGATECKEKTGGMACDLDERSIDGRLITGAPDEHSTEALAKQAEKIRKGSSNADES